MVVNVKRRRVISIEHSLILLKREEVRHSSKVNIHTSQKGLQRWDYDFPTISLFCFLDKYVKLSNSVALKTTSNKKFRLALKKSWLIKEKENG